MNTIIVPTDFSETAKNALIYALELAKKNNQQIHLVHTYELQQKAGMLPSIDHHVKKHAEQDMQILVNELYTRYPDIPIRFSIYKSTVEQGVALQARKSNASLVVMGTQGTSAFKEIFLGSNSIEVMNKSRIPVLFIPYTAINDGMNRVLLTLDGIGSNTKENLVSLKQLSKIMRLELVALHIATDPDEFIVSPYLNLLNEVFGKDKVPFYELVAEEVESTIEKFAEEIEADLICTIKRKNGFLSELLRKSTSKQMVYQYEFPLLVLNENVELTNSPIAIDHKFTNQ